MYIEIIKEELSSFLKIFFFLKQFICEEIYKLIFHDILNPMLTQEESEFHNITFLQQIMKM